MDSANVEPGSDKHILMCVDELNDAEWERDVAKAAANATETRVYDAEKAFAEARRERRLRAAR